METLHDDMQDCITHCWTCRTECEKTLFEHCLIEGGKHLEPDHVKIMTDCIQICQAAADSMVRGSPVHSVICMACADICDRCADSCESIEGEKMKQLAVVCRQCATICRDMGRGERKILQSRETGTIQQRQH